MNKPSLVETLTWAWRSRWAQKYSSVKDAEMYDLVARYYFGREKLARMVVSEFINNLENNPSQNLICDRAAGTGIITEALMNAGFDVRASDLSFEQLQILSRKFKNILAVVEDLNGIMENVADETADGLTEVAADRFMTANGQEIFVQEAARVLRKGGILVWPLIFGEFGGKLKHGWKWRWSSKTRIKLLQRNGFEIVSNEFKIKGLALPSMCRLLVAKKV